MDTSALRQPVVVLDLDGTLVDSVYQHVVAWQQAFSDVGRRIGAARLHDAIGLGGDRLVAHVAGDATEDALGDEVRELHDSHFRSMLDSVQPLDGAQELVETLASRGHPVALASSAGADLVDDLLGLLDVRQHLVAVVTSSDGGASKPAPDLVDLAVRRAGGGRAITIGDAVWDAQAAAAARVPSIGLRSGGISAARLGAAGASWVYDDPRDVLDRLDDGPFATP